MTDKKEKPQSKDRGDDRRGVFAVVMALLVVAMTSAVIMADSSKWDSSPTAIGTTVQW
jgi:Flp pilus assembly protein TadG